MILYRVWEKALLDLYDILGSDHATLDHPRAYPAASLERPRHPRLAQVLDVPARRSRTVELQQDLADAEPLSAQLQEPYAARYDVASMLAVPDADAELALDVVEVFAFDQGYLADVPVTRPEPRPLAVPVARYAAPLDGCYLLYPLHRRAALAGNEDLLDRALHLASLLNSEVIGSEFTANVREASRRGD